MGKKKLSLKPVQRGFATTSVPTKKAKDEAAAAAAAAEKAKAEEVASKEQQAQSQNGQPSEDVNQDPKSTSQHAPGDETWDNDAAVDAAAYQGLVDRLQDRADREFQRIIKSIEYDKRFAASFPRLEVNHKLRDQALEWAVQDSEVSSPENTSISSDNDKKLVNLFVTYKVLQHLGFGDEGIEQCILEGIHGDNGWAEGEEWLWLHLSEDECRQRPKDSEQVHPTLDDMVDAPLEDVAPSPIPLNSEAGSTITDKIPNLADTTTATAAGSMFETMDAVSSASESDSDDADPDINKINETWANLMLELDTMKMAAGMSKGKGKKGKGHQVVLETPDMVKLKNKISKVEKEYLFSRKDGDSLLKTLKSQRDMRALETKLRSSNVSSNTSAMSSPAPEAEGPPDASRATSIFDTASDGDQSDDEAGGIFGSMLDEQAQDSTPLPTGNTTVNVRSMPISKQQAVAGITPKAILRTALGKASKQAVISYVRLSPNARVARAGLEIRWSAEKRRVWRMEDIACEGVEEADNYVSTLALNDLLAAGDITGINWRSMPPAHRELWAELDESRALQQNIEKREFWKKIKDLGDRKATLSRSATNTGALKQSQAAAPQAGSRPSPPSYSKELETLFQKRSTSPAYLAMREGRDTLPIAPFREEIVKVLENTQILVFSGETGCGKSTQLPSFILEDQLSKGKPCKIIVTEPRRISAISLAQRVSAELGEAPGSLGGNSSLVGYSIRLESKTSPNTRLAFVTNGIALRMLEGGSEGGSKGTAFDEVTHIVVDEVHERSIESDFLLIILKELLKVRPDLKIILMSATVDAEKLSEYFGGCPTMSVPGRTFPVQVNYLEDAVEMAGWHIDDSSPYAVWERNKKTGAKQLEWNEENSREDGDLSDSDKPDDPTKLSATRYSARTVSTVNTLDSRKIPYGLIVRLLERICFEDPELASFSAATLVFMPGLAEIRKLNDELQTHPRFGTQDFVIYPLHSTISSEGQSAVFQVPAPGVRKVVISTNIAETGVTIPDITCVIDSGKQREMRYDEKRQLSRLVETYIARSNAKQRRGRAGRVQEGLAFHLFTKARHDTQLAEHPIPEMLRLSLQDLALRIKILKVKLGSSVEEVLLRALDPPSSTNIQRAVAALVEVKALNTNEDITPMGRLLSKLPMDVHLGKFLLVAALFRCLDPALTIAATLNSKSPFITPFGFEAQANAAKKGFATDNSDFLTLVNVFDSWRSASDNPNFVRTFCKRNYVSHQNLQQIEELRQQLLTYLVDSSFIEASPELKQGIAKARYNRGFRTRFVTVPPEYNTNAKNTQILGAALAAGLYPKLLVIDPAGGMRTVTNQQAVAIHPSSVNHRVSTSEFGTGHLVYFTLMQSKRLYAWETGPVDDQALALVCGDTAEIKFSAGSLQIDRKLRYQVEPKSALAIKLLREQFAKAMTTRLKGDTLTSRQEQWFALGLRCIANEDDREDQGVIVM